VLVHLLHCHMLVHSLPSTTTDGLAVPAAASAQFTIHVLALHADPLPCCCATGPILVADPRIAFCCKGEAALEQHFQLWDWGMWMDLTSQPLVKVVGYLRQHVPDIDVATAANSIINRMGILHCKSPVTSPGMLHAAYCIMHA
jgi:hypothetical protein